MRTHLLSQHASRRLSHTLAFFGSAQVPTPEPRNITNEMLQTLAGSRAVAGPQLALDRQYQPEYGRLGLDLARQAQQGYTDANGVYHPGSLGLTTAQRAGDVSDVERLGLRSSNAFLNANPRLRAALDLLNRRTADTPILRTLNSQANNELDLNGRLSPSDARNSDQTARAGFADRGMVGGNPSLAAEVLARDAAVRARRQESRSFASGVQGLNQQQNDFIGRATQITGSALSDPLMAILNRSSGSGFSGSGGGRQMIGTGSSLYDPNNAYAADVYNTNFNATAAAGIANANNSAATNNAYLGAGSAIAAAAIVAI